MGDGLNLQAIRDLVFGAISASVLGFLGFFGPTIVHALRSGQSVSAETFVSAVEGGGLLQLCLLGVSGIIVGYFFRIPLWVIGVSTVISLPIWSLIDMQLAYAEGVERHNLLPLEWLFYAVYGLPGMLGAWISQRWFRSWEAGSP